jgi:hypothetical protein
MLGLSLHGWENTMVMSLIIAGFFALIAGAATWAVVQLQREELAESKNEFDKYKLTVEGQVSEAKKEGIKAGETAGNALVRAAELEREAAILRLQLNREIQKHAQRLLTDEQRESMISELRGKLTEIAIVTQNDPEAQAFSVQLLSVFSSAGIKMYAPEVPREDKWFAPAGLMIYSPVGSTEDQLKGDPLYRALKAANLFGGTMGAPFVSGQPRIPDLPVIQGYKGRVLYIGQKSPF